MLTPHANRRRSVDGVAGRDAHANVSSASPTGGPPRPARGRPPRATRAGRRCRRRSARRGRSRRARAGRTSRSSRVAQVAAEFDEGVRVGSRAVGRQREEALRRRPGRPAREAGPVEQDRAVDRGRAGAGELQRDVRAEPAADDGDLAVGAVAGQRGERRVGVAEQQLRGVPAAARDRRLAVSGEVERGDRPRHASPTSGPSAARPRRARAGSAAGAPVAAVARWWSASSTWLWRSG